MRFPKDTSEIAPLFLLTGYARVNSYGGTLDTRIEVHLDPNRNVKWAYQMREALSEANLKTLLRWRCDGRHAPLLIEA